MDTIFTVPVDIAVLCAKWLRKRAGRPLTKDLQPFLGTDDMEDAYRWFPTQPDHVPFSVIAVQDHEGKIVFAIANAHLFGLAAAVNNFNRIPELLTSVARRIFGVPTWHFFDDAGTLSVGEHDCQLTQGTSTEPPANRLRMISMKAQLPSAPT